MRIPYEEGFIEYEAGTAAVFISSIDMLVSTFEAMKTHYARILDEAVNMAASRGKHSLTVIPENIRTISFPPLN